MPPDEQILVVPRSVFDAAGSFQGFCDNPRPYLDAFFGGGEATFMSRAAAEDDPSFKQLISYVVIQSGDSVFAYTRGKAGGESRLHAKRSVGVGGHVSEGDCLGVAGEAALAMATSRELFEEVRLLDWADGDLQVMGLINDDSNAVGRVHLGVVYSLKLASPEAESREDALLDAGFVKLADARANPEEYETWSQLVLAHLAHP